MEIGEVVNILDVSVPNKKYIKCKIIEIYKKRYHNMYLCENIRNKQKITFTDMDINCTECNKIRRIYGNKKGTRKLQ